MFKIATLSALLLGASFFTGTSASAAYECTTNPAICKAICGSTVCGNFSAGDRDIRRMERAARVQSVAAQPAGSKPSRASGKGYTCFNPAICRAVCGSTTC